MRRAKQPNPATPPTDIARLEHVPLGQLRGWPRNPKQHDLLSIRRSYDRFGFVLPLVEDATSTQLVAGHGRLEVLLQMRDAGEEPPRRIIVDEHGDWLVPVLRGVTFADEREAEAYIVADNKLAEVGGWDERLLADVLGDLDLDDALVTGFSEAELQRLLEPAVGSGTAGAGADDPWGAGGNTGDDSDDGFVKFLFGDYAGRVRRSTYEAFVREYNRRRAVSQAVMLDDVLAAWLALEGGTDAVAT